MDIQRRKVFVQILPAMVVATLMIGTPKLILLGLLIPIFQVHVASMKRSKTEQEDNLK